MKSQIIFFAVFSSKIILNSFDKFFVPPVPNSGIWTNQRLKKKKKSFLRMCQLNNIFIKNQSQFKLIEILEPIKATLVWLFNVAFITKIIYWIKILEHTEFGIFVKTCDGYRLAP